MKTITVRVPVMRVGRGGVRVTVAHRPVSVMLSGNRFEIASRSGVVFALGEQLADGSVWLSEVDRAADAMRSVDLAALSYVVATGLLGQRRLPTQTLAAARVRAGDRTAEIAIRPRGAR